MLADVTLPIVAAALGARAITITAEVKTNCSTFECVKVLTFEIITHLKHPFLKLIEIPLLKAFRPFQMYCNSCGALHRGRRNTF